jgi:hypothetical protein
MRLSYRSKENYDVIKCCTGLLPSDGVLAGFSTESAEIILTESKDN